MDCILNKSKKAYDRGHEFGTKTGTALGAAAGGAIGMVVGGGLSGAGCTMVLPVVGTVGCGASGAAMGGAAGATAGAIVGGTKGSAAIGGFNGIAGGLAGIVSCSSSDDGGEKDCEETEEQRCRKVKNECIEDCSDEAMPTGDHGFKFWNCVNSCMERRGC